MKKKRLLILYLLLGICTWGHALNPITSHSRQHPAQTSTQKLSATVQDGKIILNIPESAIGKELLITAQANEGFGLRNRPLNLFQQRKIRGKNNNREQRIKTCL